MSNILVRNLEKRKRNHARFQKTFGVSLSRFFGNLTGFDVVEFDKFVKPQEGESTADAVERKWGKEAVNIIRDLFYKTWA